MSRRTFSCVALLVLLLGIVGRLPDGRSDPPVKGKLKPAAVKATARSETPRAPRSNTPLRKKLNELVTLEKGIDANTPLKDALAFLSDRIDITILVDNQAFTAEGIESVEAQAVQLPPLVDVRLDTVLQKLAAQVRGAYFLQSDYIEITTAQHALLTVWGIANAEPTDEPGRRRQQLPLVHTSFAGRPLEAALRELADLSGISIVLDRRRAGDKARVPVNATLDNVPVDGAARLLASQADLSLAQLDNVLFVTTPGRAQSVRAREDRNVADEGRTPDMIFAQQLHQPVELSFDDVPLGELVRQLGQDTGIQVLLDPRFAESAQVLVTLHVKEVSLETAVRLIAEIANLKPVPLGNLLFVTSPANATRIQADSDRIHDQAAKAAGFGLGGGAGLAAGGLGGGGLGFGGGALGFSAGFATAGPPRVIGPPVRKATKTDEGPVAKAVLSAPASRALGRSEQLSRKLAEAVTLKKGIEENTPLKDALAFLNQQFKLAPVLINTTSFNADGKNNVEDMPVKLPRLAGIRLSTVLEKLVAQVNGAYLVRADHIEILPASHRQLEIWGQPAEESPVKRRRMLPVACAAFEQRPLDEALRELSASTGFNIVLDTRHAGESGQAAITAAFNNAPVDTAVQLLADQVGLQAVLLDNVLQVTTRDRARVLSLEQERINQRGLVPNPASASAPMG